MKIQNISNVEKFFQVIDSCAGKVELVTGEGDRLNLKSKLCQYVSMAKIFSHSILFPVSRWYLLIKLFKSFNINVIYDTI